MGVAGTTMYAPPEQYTSQAGRQFNPKFDIWSLGVTLHKLLTGHYPFPSKCLEAPEAMVYYLCRVLPKEPLVFDHPQLDEHTKSLIASMLVAVGERPSIED